MTPKLISERIVLRNIKNQDIFGIYEIFSDSETMNLIGGQTQLNDFDNKTFVENSRIESEMGISYFWAITLKNSPEFIGYVTLKSYQSKYFNQSFRVMGESIFNPDFEKLFDRSNAWEINYALLADFRNTGIMSESVSLILDFCRNIKISPIYARVNPEVNNSASIKVLERNNFIDFTLNVKSQLYKIFSSESLIEKNYLGLIYKWEA